MSEEHRRRQDWFSEDIANGTTEYEAGSGKRTPFWKRVLRQDPIFRVDVNKSNVIGSRVADSPVSRLERRHKPLVDLDYEHTYVRSSTPRHAHLYLGVEISHWRWVILMLGLWVGRVISIGYLAHSLRRGQSFVRQPWEHK